MERTRSSLPARPRTFVPLGGRGNHRRGNLRAGWVLGRASFRRYSQYRAAAFAGSIANTVFGLIRASIMIGAVGSAGGSFGGYDAAQAVTFAWLTQAFIGPVNIFTWTELSDRVRTGDIAIDLARPLDVMGAFLAADLGRATYVAIPRAVMPLTVGALVTGLVLPLEPLPYVLGVISLALAVVVSFLCRFLVNLSAFWLLDARGVVGLYVLLSNLLSGLLLPISWFPPWLELLARLTPFPTFIQSPADLFMGRATGLEALEVLGVQVLWVVILTVLGRLAMRAATRTLVVQGG